MNNASHISLNPLTEDEKLKIENYIHENQGLITYYVKRFENPRYSKSDFRQQAYLGICQAFQKIRMKKYKHLKSKKNKNKLKYFVTFFIKKRIADLFEQSRHLNTNLNRSSHDFEMKNVIVHYNRKRGLFKYKTPIIMDAENSYLDKLYKKHENLEIPLDNIDSDVRILL